MIHSLIILAGTVFFIWFSIPLFTHRILNIGNLTGLVVSGILLIGGIFYKNFQQGIFYLQKYFLGKCVIGIMAIAIGIVVITAVIETVLIVKASAKKPQENATLIVLGCKVYGEHASRSLRERLDAALIYLEEDPNSQCIVSGGMGEGEKISEAECMYRYLTKKGINSSRITKEDKSTSTRENLRFSRKIIEEKGLSQISCTDEIEKLVNEVLNNNPKSIEDFKAGKTQAIGFLMGQVMKASKGKANPPVAKQMIEEKLNNM